ncbi:fasciclin domain-containing protein [Prevotella sp. E2-28]|uniref:fasciclin domain-containing protein n=1 Tax=Prevotella sp. E2-28 TaxID=2913620 RepID=UPI001ED9F639|nr:fasciclin domain-containing protein [Prevotella sp. E2-28]UKK53787.1 fasciclin domain-containing protein [Prevotella sp. E2-28]
MNIKKNIKVALMALAALTVTGSMTSCSDEPDSQYFYTFTGEMLSDYISNREQYSDFKTIVERADMMDLLSTYGRYTCFLPDNKAVEAYLQKRGLSSVDDLSAADCDTIARTHLVQNMYSTFEMNLDFLPTYNMQGRYLATKAAVDEKGNAVIQIEGTAHIIFSDTLENGQIVHQNDSVENGIVQPVNMVIEKSNCYIADILRDNKNLSLFHEALVATGVNREIEKIEDVTYSKNQPKYKYRSHTHSEVAWVPDKKKYGFTAFVEPDSIYRNYFENGLNGQPIDTSKGDLYALYDLACKLYDPTFPEDVDKPGHSFDNLTDSVNPLKRFVQYHIMNRYVPGTQKLTSMEIEEHSGPFGFDVNLVNPTEWFTTLLPHTMLKVSQLTMNKDEQKRDCRGNDRDKVKRFFLNRRYGETSDYTIRGSLIEKDVEEEYENDALNGHYFYVDDLVAFTTDVRDKVQNMRIRMDFSTVFPEVMTNDMRDEGNYRGDDPDNVPDESNEPKNGKNRYFPDGYLDGVTVNNDGHLVLRRPHLYYWSWQGDEWNLFGDYDMTFRIPPVPFSGEWQFRLGFCSIPTRGVMQVYYDGIPQGIPLDMTKDLNTEMYLGDRYQSYDNYMKMSDEEKAEYQKVLKNLGAYDDGRSQLIGQKDHPLGNASGMYRRIICQTYVDATKDHYIRFRVASDGKGNNNEFMFDFWEMVPKSVYAVDGDGAMEDDL